MCGILGILSHHLPDTAIVRDALDSLKHRGPDDEGYVFLKTREDFSVPASGPDTVPTLKERYRDVCLVDGTGCDLVFANRRLAILDLSSKGHQPMSYGNGDLWITYNGEIFNFREVRTELQARGHVFHSRTDTEVILAAFAEWGEACVSKFNGQWAFCIFDRRKGTLFCSRDRFGIKPFYYWADGEYFAFASEIKALLTLPFVTTAPDASVLHDFVAFTMLHHVPQTAFKGICQLMPGHNVRLDIVSGSVMQYSYYDLSYNQESGRYDHAQALAYADDIRDLLIDAVRVRLLSDVPVGSCLSGGLDSSSIVVIVNKLLREGGTADSRIGERQKTFSLGYDDPRVNERHYAEEIINHTQVEGFFAYPTGEGLWKELEPFLYHHEGLCFATNIYAGWDVTRLASRHVKVVLNGQGGDEAFGGYLSRYAPIHCADFVKGGKIGQLARYLGKQRQLYGRQEWRQCLARGLYLSLVPDALKVRLFMLRNRDRLGLLEQVVGESSLKGDSLDRMCDQVRSLNHRLWRDVTRDYLPQLLTYDDSNASAFSIENRVPFVDHRLIEYLFSLPSVYKLHNGWSKWLLRLAMRDLLPEAILWRKDKIGMSTPEQRWARDCASPMPEYMAKYGITAYDHFVWRLYLAERLLRRYGD